MAIVKSLRGRDVDMEKLKLRNELALAVGNAKVNARGDEIGPGGKIILKNHNTVSNTTHVPIQYAQREEQAVAPTPVVTQTPATSRVKANPVVKDVASMDPEGNE